MTRPMTIFKRIRGMEVVLDALISLLVKKAVITRGELQEEIFLRAETTGKIVGDIEYRE